MGQVGQPGLVDGSLRQAPGALGLRRLPLPVPPAVGQDETQVAGLFAEAWRSQWRLSSGRPARDGQQTQDIETTADTGAAYAALRWSCFSRCSPW